MAEFDENGYPIAGSKPRQRREFDADGNPVAPVAFDLTGEITNALRSANDFLMLGAADEYEGAVNTASDVLSGKIGLADAPKAFERYRGASEFNRKEFEAQRPLAAIAAKTTGGIVTAPLAATRAASATTLARSSMPLASELASRAAGAGRPLLESAKTGLLGGSLGGYFSASPEHRAQGAAVGAATGAIVSPVVTAGVSSLAMRAKTPEEKAFAMVGRALDEGGALTAMTRRGDNNAVPAMQIRANKLPPLGGDVEETIMELGGEGAKGLARAVANVPGPGQKIATDALVGRREGMGKRVIAAAQKAAGSPKDWGDAVVGMATEGKKIQRELYDAALNGAENVTFGAGDARGLARDVDDFLYDIDKGPGILPDDASMTGLQRARKVVQRLEDLAGSGRFTLRGFERVRQQLNSIYRSVAGKDGFDSGAVRNVIARADARMDEIAGARTAAGDESFAGSLQQIKAARAEYGTTEQMKEAIDQGRRVFKDDAVDTLLWMDNDGRGRQQGEADGYMVGLVKAIEDAVNRNDAAAISRINRDKNLQAALTQSLGPAGAKSLMARINREATMNQNANAILAGSRTTPLREEIDRYTKGEDDMAFMADLVVNQTPVRSIFLKAFQAAYNRMNRPGIYNPEVNKAVADILYNRATKERVEYLLRMIRDDPASAAAARDALRSNAIGAGGVAGAQSGATAGEAVGSRQRPN